MAKFGRNLVVETHEHNYIESGFKVTIFRAEGREAGGPVMTLQGGWTDNLSHSMRDLAEAAVEASDMELIVAAVATTRSPDLMRRACGIARSGVHRSKAGAGAA